MLAETVTATFECIILELRHLHVRAKLAISVFLVKKWKWKMKNRKKDFSPMVFKSISSC